MVESTRRNNLARLLTHLIHGTEEHAPSATHEPASTLHVTSHVARDLLQNAAYFNSVPKVVAEYVTNAIDNAPQGKRIDCEVTFTRDTICIADNAAGMTYKELSNFFQMHGENVQRKRGRRVRGKFGTGKSAAFGIANSLRVETVKAGKRSVVELHRADVEAVKDGQPIALREIVVNQATRAGSGTTIVIEDLHVKKLDGDAVRAYLERTLGRHLRQHVVSIDDVICKYHAPASTKSFRFKAPRAVSQVSGATVCVLKISREPLGRDDNAIAVLCNGFLHAMTLAGKQAEPFVEYIFGEVEAPRLDMDDEPIPAFDNTRSLTLNAQNPRVQTLLEWLAGCIEEVRAELLAREQRRRYSKQTRLLRKIAGDLQTFLDDDFRLVQTTLPWATLRGGTQRSKRARDLSTNRKPAQAAAPAKSLLERGQAWVNRLVGKPEAQPDVKHTPANIRRVHFEIYYGRMGIDAARSRYVPARNAIYLNRDHPQLRTAEAEAGIDSLTFKMLSFDVAFTTYALAVVSELADQGIEIADPIDASEMMMEILDRLGRKAAEHFTQIVDSAPADSAPQSEEKSLEQSDDG